MEGRKLELEETHPERSQAKLAAAVQESKNRLEKEASQKAAAAAQHFAKEPQLEFAASLAQHLKRKVLALGEGHIPLRNVKNSKNVPFNK